MANITELVFVLDRSGSMESLTSETIGGFNSLIAKQKSEAEGGKINVTTVLFDDQYEVLHKHAPIEEIDRLTEKDYYARGCTALLDAVGKTILSVSRKIEDTPFSEKPEKVLFVITTDGYENASSEFTKKDVKTLISDKQEKFGWKFLFLGANIDAVSEADSIGIRSVGAAKPSASRAGVRSTFDAVCEVASFMRKSDARSKTFNESFDATCKASLDSIE